MIPQDQNLILYATASAPRQSPTEGILITNYPMDEVLANLSTLVHWGEDFVLNLTTAPEMEHVVCPNGEFTIKNNQIHTSRETGFVKASFKSESQPQITRDMLKEPYQMPEVIIIGEPVKGRISLLTTYRITNGKNAADLVGKPVVIFNEAGEHLTHLFKKHSFPLQDPANQVLATADGEYLGIGSSHSRGESSNRSYAHYLLAFRTVADIPAPAPAAQTAA